MDILKKTQGEKNSITQGKNSRFWQIAEIPNFAVMDIYIPNKCLKLEGVAENMSKLEAWPSIHIMLMDSRHKKDIKKTVR